jgi:23S rRNA (cytosine1962-C5)-methyltransferase
MARRIVAEGREGDNERQGRPSVAGRRRSGRRGSNSTAGGGGRTRAAGRAGNENRDDQGEDRDTKRSIHVLHDAEYAHRRVPVLGSSGDDGPVPRDEYELIDAGDGRRLERFGSRLVDRPAPSTADEPRRAARDAWAGAALRFDRDQGWIGGDLQAWTIAIEIVTLELRPTGAGQLGFFPEHTLAWPWLRDRATQTERPAPEILHLFAYTGATTLALASAGARVTHVDASRPAVAWARRNAALSGLGEHPIRWIVDDALAFVRREARRGRRYAGLVLDPPTFGHGPSGARWELDQTLPDLLGACAAVAEPDAFVLLTAHATALTPADLASALEIAFGIPAELESEDVALDAASGAVLPLGVAARMIRG